MEVAHIAYDSHKVKYEDLLKHFFSFHDPTTPNRQGNDRGTQYASAIFTHSLEQSEDAQSVKDTVDKLIKDGAIKKFQEDKCSTEIHDATRFYVAQPEH